MAGIAIYVVSVVNIKHKHDTARRISIIMDKSKNLMITRQQCGLLHNRALFHNSIVASHRSASRNTNNDVQLKAFIHETGLRIALFLSLATVIDVTIFSI